MRGRNLTVRVLKNITSSALQHARSAPVESSRMVPERRSPASRLDSDHSNLGVTKKLIEQSDRIAAAAHARDEQIRKAARFGDDLIASLASDHRLKISYHRGIRMRAQGRAEPIVGIADIGDPVAKRLIDRAFERLASVVHARC